MVRGFGRRRSHKLTRRAGFTLALAVRHTSSIACRLRFQFNSLKDTSCACLLDYSDLQPPGALEPSFVTRFRVVSRGHGRCNVVEWSYSASAMSCISPHLSSTTELLKR